jgi:hypothetical protein
MNSPLMPSLTLLLYTTETYPNRDEGRRLINVKSCPGKSSLRHVGDGVVVVLLWDHHRRQQPFQLQHWFHFLWSLHATILVSMSISYLQYQISIDHLTNSAKENTGHVVKFRKGICLINFTTTTTTTTTSSSNRNKEETYISAEQDDRM